MSAIGLDINSVWEFTKNILPGLFALAVSFFGSKKVLTAADLDLSQEDLAFITGGLIKGALHLDNIDTIERCVLESTDKMSTFTSELTEAIPLLLSKTPSISDIASAIVHMGKGFKDLGDHAAQCDGDLRASKEMEIFNEMTTIFSDVTYKDIAMKTGSNLMVNGVDIFRELSTGYTNYFAKQYEQFGMSIGSALALVFIGSEILDTKDGEELKKDIEAFDFAGLNDGSMTPEMNAEYRAYLECLLDKHKGISTECNHNITAPDVKIPEFHEITADEIEDMIDGSWYPKSDKLKQFIQ